MEKAHRIRIARAEDVEAVVALERKTETLPHWPVAEYLAAVSIAVSRAADMQLKSRCFFVADRADGAVAGFAVGTAMALDGELTAELESVGVAESERRAGAGRALCEAVIAWSREIRAGHIELEVRSRSVGPISLYAALGFAAVGRRAVYYRDPVDDAILMRLGLASCPKPSAQAVRDL